MFNGKRFFFFKGILPYKVIKEKMAHVKCLDFIFRGIKAVE